MTTEKNNTNDDAEIWQQIDAFITAFRTRNLDLMMSLYAPAMVSFGWFLASELTKPAKELYLIPAGFS